ncbi:MAG: hypothetical protein IKW33_01890 [Clostridia bacterium]|nr:hypothetical protein [Clostridia bacterium]
MSFFKSVAFRCITVLLALAVIFGGTLAILNDVLYVSPEERTARAIKSVYGVEMKYQTRLDVDSTNTEINQALTCEYGTINKIYEIKQDGNNYDLLFHTTGFYGYNNGKISLWVKVSVNFTTEQPTEDDYKIDTVILASFEKQTLMSKFTGDFYANFTVDLTQEFIDGKIFTSDKYDTDNIKNIITGATKSANAACNAVNCVLDYVWGAN